jgi:hypothetical protein
MHVIFLCLAALLVGAGLGYGFRGLIHKEVSKVDLAAFATRLELVATTDVATVKVEVLKVADGIRRL